MLMPAMMVRNDVHVSVLQNTGTEHYFKKKAQKNGELVPGLYHRPEI